MPMEMHRYVDYVCLRALFMAVFFGLCIAAVPARGDEMAGVAAPNASKDQVAAMLVQAAGEDEALASDARKQLAKLGAPVVTALISALDSKNDITREVVVSVLSSISDPNAVKPLAGLLGHTDLGVANAASWSLRRIGTPAAEELAAALTGRDKAAHFPAAYALSGIGAYTQADPWLAALKSDDSRVRYYAAVALGNSTDARVADALQKAADDSESHVRQMVAASRAKVEAARRAAGVKEAPEDAAVETARYQESMAAWNDGSPASVELLIRGLQDRSQRIRVHCAWALGALQNARGIEPLIKVIEVPVDPQQVSYAARSLAQITGQEFGPDAKAWRRWFDRDTASKKQDAKRK